MGTTLGCEPAFLPLGIEIHLKGRVSAHLEQLVSCSASMCVECKQQKPNSGCQGAQNWQIGGRENSRNGQEPKEAGSQKHGQSYPGSWARSTARWLDSRTAAVSARRGHGDGVRLSLWTTPPLKIPGPGQQCLFGQAWSTGQGT